MNLELGTEQRDLIAATTEVCSALAPSWRDGGPPDRAALKTLGQVGVLGVRHPEPHGAGLSPVEAALVAHECGATLAPTAALIWADLIGPALPGVLTGEVSVTGTFDPGGVVGFGGGTDLAVLLEEHGARVCESAALSWEPVPSPDPTVPRARPVADRRGGEVVADAATVGEWRWQSRVLAAAHLVGLGRAAVSAATGHAARREQFGQAVGGFQAVKHLLADAHTAVELATSQVLIASLCWAEGHPRARDQATAAVIVAARAAVSAGETAIQVLGGMGFTWETLPHHYYKRALLLQGEFCSGGLTRELAGRDITLNGSSTG